MKVLLDTHTLIWSFQESDLLSKKVFETLQDPAVTEILVSSISIWEVSKLKSKNRIQLGLPLQQWFLKALAHPKIRVVDVTPEIAIDACFLPSSFHGDPSDQILVATARAEAAILLTKDRRILDYPHVKSLW